MKALADYVHGKGLKLGIYGSPGNEASRRVSGVLRVRKTGRDDLCLHGESII